ncbi:MAG TPA: DctP family TRAP transporter solute-binding subunit [Symbiobacteriaceae bacterium]|nr:DctP family TRAP transporter solute-binding subunit [Symbiobacteriaceae bacterium]
MMIPLVLLGLTLTACGGPVAADYEQVSPDDRIVVKFSHVVAENTPKGQAARRFAALVKERTGGKVEVQVFANSQLYRDGEELDALRSNSVQFVAPSLSKLGDIDPLWQVFDLPYLFPDPAAPERLIAGSTGQKLYGNLRRQGLEPVAFWLNGFKVITSARGPVMVPEDVRGLRFRIQPSLVTRDALTALSAEVSIQSFDSLYGALANGEVDAQENTPTNILSKRVYEVQPYMTLTNHSYLGYVVITNQKFWNGLTPEMREAFREAMSETTQWVRESAELLNEQALNQIRFYGKVDIYQPTLAQLEAWKSAMNIAYRRAEDRLGVETIRTVIEEAGTK